MGDNFCSIVELPRRFLFVLESGRLNVMDDEVGSYMVLLAMPGGAGGPRLEFGFTNYVLFFWFYVLFSLLVFFRTLLTAGDFFVKLFVTI